MIIIIERKKMIIKSFGLNSSKLRFERFQTSFETFEQSSNQSGQFNYKFVKTSSNDEHLNLNKLLLLLLSINKKP